ncbi:MAG: hypothetical protein Q8O72_10535 [Bacteroidales bacterium]|nr:hypothetical protein [Bacteroidales bacterium]
MDKLFLILAIIAVIYFFFNKKILDAFKNPNIIEPLKKIAIPVIVVALLFFGIKQCMKNSVPNKLSIEENAYYTSQNYIKDYLKSPSTAKFPYYPSAEIIVVTMPQDKNLYAVKSWVDAKNAFGVPIRMQYLMHLKYLETHWKLESLVIDGDKVY